MAAFMFRPRKSDKQVIYGIYDPRDNLIRYIGISGNPAKRLYQHIAKPRTKSMGEWLDAMIREGVRPKWRKLDSAREWHDGMHVERWWINTYSLVFPNQLFNIFNVNGFISVQKFTREVCSKRGRERELRQHAKWEAMWAGRRKARRMLLRGSRNIERIAEKCGIDTAGVRRELYDIEPQEFYVKFRGESLSQNQWAKRVGISSSAMSYRLENWSKKRALTTPKKSA